MPDPVSGNVRVGMRRRRTRHHRRNKLFRRLFAAATLALVTAGAAAFALKYFSPSLFSAKRSVPILQSVELSRDRAASMDQLLQARQPRPIYPYSVVPGGVDDVQELKWAAEHDPVVAAHYAGFDYARAQVVRLTLARTVYVSYRIGNRIYWTRRRLKLHKGEKLITDGKMTARTRCANRVEEAPQQEASSAEPPAERFDEPFQEGGGTAMRTPPVAFESALMNRPETPGIGPASPLALYDPFVGGSLGSLSPPPVPSGLCAPVKKKGSTITIEGESGTGKNKKKLGPCGGGSPGVVPEPRTWVLFASGLAFIYWQARRNVARV